MDDFNHPPGCPKLSLPDDIGIQAQPFGNGSRFEPVDES
jgi:hypothetical protein